MKQEFTLPEKRLLELIELKWIDASTKMIILKYMVYDRSFKYIIDVEIAYERLFKNHWELTYKV